MFNLIFRTFEVAVFSVIVGIICVALFAVFMPIFMVIAFLFCAIFLKISFFCLGHAVICAKVIIGLLLAEFFWAVWEFRNESIFSLIF